MQKQHPKCTKQKGLGQYFTISESLQKFVFDKVKHKSSPLLEPSFGAGHLLKPFKAYDENYPMLCYEIDATIKPVITSHPSQTLIYADFMKQNLTQKFKTIIGNPPYVKTSSGNLYIQFIEKCYTHLDDDGGELIFIVPSDFLKLTSASQILQTMTQNGSFTDILFPHDEALFEGASIDVVVFRYEKGLKQDKTLVNGKEMFCNVMNGIVTFSDTLVQGTPLQDMFHVYVGLVSARDEVYRVPFGNTEILVDKDKVERFIFTETFPTSSEQINTHLLSHKETLLARGIRKFSDANWFEWGAPRNIMNIRKYEGRPCIYVRNLTRQKEVGFLGTVRYFGGALLCLIPKTEMSEYTLKKVVMYINSTAFQSEYIYAGRFKIGQKQLCNASLPSP